MKVKRVKKVYDVAIKRRRKLLYFLDFFFWSPRYDFRAGTWALRYCKGPRKLLYVHFFDFMDSRICVPSFESLFFLNFLGFLNFRDFLGFFDIPGQQTSLRIEV